MEHREVVHQWIELADNDLAIAIHAAKTMHPVPYEIVCFHCQQFVEKYLKGFLVSRGLEPPYIHDLVKLIVLCEAENPEYEQIKQKCIALTQYGVQPRYPGGMQINEEDMFGALRFAEEIKVFIREKAPELFQAVKK